MSNCNNNDFTLGGNLPNLNYKVGRRKHFNGLVPIYQDKANYNLNADSYFDYLADLNYYLFVVEMAINRLMDRNLEVKNTKSIEFIKKGDWIENGQCCPNNYDDLISLYANVILSSYIKEVNLDSISPYVFKLPNSLSIKDDGLYSPDYGIIIDGINSKINDIDKDITNIKNEIIDIKDDITNIKNDINNMGNKYDDILQKIINNLYNSGGITNNDINNFEFNRSIVTGNINHLLGTDVNGNLGLFATKSRENQTMMKPSTK